MELCSVPKKLCRQLKKFGMPIGYTMDLGNWYWQKENPNQAFDLLKDKISIFSFEKY